VPSGVWTSTRSDVRLYLVYLICSPDLSTSTG
jgi:hypothetical protein